MPIQNWGILRKLRSRALPLSARCSGGRSILTYTKSWTRQSRNKSPVTIRQPPWGFQEEKRRKRMGEERAPRAQAPWSRLKPRVALSPGRVDIMVLEKLPLPPLPKPLMKQARSSTAGRPIPAVKSR